MSKSILKIVATAALVGLSSNAMAEHLQKTFRQMDTNNDGRLSLEEASAGKTGEHKTECLAMFKVADTNSDGVLTLAEHNKGLTAMSDKKFKTMDADNDGKLTLAEALAGKTGDEKAHCEAMFKQCDADNNGQVTLKEHAKGMRMAGAKTFQDMDANDDDRLSADEAVVGKTGEEKAECMAMFKDADANSDGLLTKSEYNKGTAMMGQKKFKKMDANADGKVTLAEAVLGKDGDEKTRCEAQFQECDADNDGVITLDEHTDRYDENTRGEAKTSFDQSESPADIKITAAIRRAVMKANPDLSTSAENCKIITDKGTVTLRGAVANQAEKDTINTLAKNTPGVVSVDNQLEIKTP